MGVDDSSGTLTHEEAVVVLEDIGKEMAWCGDDAFAEVWKFIDFSTAIGFAMWTHGADEALRIFGRADESAKFHQRLIKMGAGG